MKKHLFNFVAYAVTVAFVIGCIYGFSAVVGLVLTALGVN